jgi:hypothetical protein
MQAPLISEEESLSSDTPNGGEGRWLTPTSFLAGVGGDGESMPNTLKHQMWQTPTAHDSARSATAFGLFQQAWRTPTAFDATRTDGAETGTLHRQAFDLLTSGHPGQEAPSRVDLNPQFVEWLMGFPIGWTGFTPLGTRWFRWLLRMRSELSRLGR